MPSSTDRIEKSIVLPVTRSRVWRALTDVREFNKWFGVELTAPFTPGAVVSGNITIPGYEHVAMTAWVETIEPERAFSFRWHPNATDTSIDYSADATTLVAFTLEEVPEGTRLVVTESGFDALPASRRLQAFNGNSKGWDSQMQRITKYLVESSGPSHA